MLDIAQLIVIQISYNTFNSYFVNEVVQKLETEYELKVL